MLTDDLLDVLFGLVTFLVTLFPAYTVPHGPGLAVFGAANLVLPLDTLAVCFGATVGFAAVALIVWVVKMIFNAIRGSGA